MLFIIIILIGLIKNKKKIIYWAIGIFYIISTPIFAKKFFKIVEGDEYRSPISSIDSADAIVVLSGMLEINVIRDSVYIEWGDPDRFFGGVDLFKAHKASKIVFTGGKMYGNKIQINEGEVLKNYAIKSGISKQYIWITKKVENTADEAIALKELIGSKKKIILVTSAFHMYRAKMLFEKQSFIVIPYKVDYKISRNNTTTLMDILPNAGNIKLIEIGIREIIGSIFYLILS
jgi:uncharacterized SAM-binding protein YcdF (DUF218 family)